MTEQEREPVKVLREQQQHSTDNTTCTSSDDYEDDDHHDDVPLGDDGGCGCVGGSNTDETSICSGRSFLSQSTGYSGTGTRVINVNAAVDAIDPDAVDFQPLLMCPSTGAPLHEHLHAVDSLRNFRNFANGGRSEQHDYACGNGASCSHEGQMDGATIASNPYAFLSSAMRGVGLICRDLRARERLTSLFRFGRDALGATRSFERRVRTRIVSPLLWQVCPDTAFMSEDQPSMLASLAICSVFFVIVIMAGALSSAISRVLSPSAPPRAALSKSLRYDANNPDVVATATAAASLAPPRGTSIPRTFQIVADVDDLPLGLMDTAVYWHVPRSAGTTLMQVVSSCFGRVVASDIGGLGGHATDEQLKIVPKEFGNFVNVDTTTPRGIARAKKLGLVPSRMASVVFSPYVHETLTLFDGRHRGRFFTVLRDPVSRIVSMYYYQKRQGTLSAAGSLEDFVKTDGENWMTRMLTNSMTGSIDARQLNVAKETLRRKFLVGLLDDKTETLRRIEQYFGWKFPSPVAQNCKNDKLYFEFNSKNEHPVLDLKDPVALLIQKMNRYDVELYEYAKILFKEQERLFWKASKELTGGQQ